MSSKLGILELPMRGLVQLLAVSGCGAIASHPSSAASLRPDQLEDSPASSSLGITFPEGTLLPAVQCIYYLVLNGSTQLPLFEAQAKALGLWDRVTVITSLPDPEGKAAGCFRAHVKGWNDALSRGCEHTMMVEEDLWFNEPVVESSMGHANSFLESKASYDMLFLGYTPQVNFSKYVRYNASNSRCYGPVSDQVLKPRA